MYTSLYIQMCIHFFEFIILFCLITFILIKMNKFFLLVISFACLLTSVACGGGSNDANSKTQSSEVASVASGEVPANFATFDTTSFAISYPNFMDVTFRKDNCVNARAKDGSMSFDATYNTTGPALSELGKYADNLEPMVKNNNFNVTEKNVDGNVMIIKGENDKECAMYFAVMQKDKIGLAGKVVYDKEKAAEYEPYCQQMLNSIVFK